MVLILPPHRRFRGLIKGKVLLGCERKRAPSDSITFFFLSSCFCVCITCVFCFQVLSQSSFYALLCLTCFCLVIFSVLLCFFFSYKNLKNWKKKNYKNSVCFMYIGTCVPWMAIETKFSKFCISCSLDEHLYAQLSKWALWLLFVMRKVKLSLVLNTHITLFYGKD